MTFSLTPAGSPEVPRTAAAWVRGTALPAVATALHDVGVAREAAASGLVGASGLAYAVHAGTLLSHIGRFRDRLEHAAALVESYAERLASHEATLLGIRAEALACGFEVVGDTVLPPVGVLGAVRWSELASAVLTEHQSLATWVHDVLDAAVPSFTDPDLARWVAAFLDDNRVGFATGVLEAAATRGGSLLTARGLSEVAEHLHGAGRLLGPASTAYEAVVALEGDQPAGDLVGLAGGVALAALAPALVVSSSAVAVTATGVLLAAGGTLAAKHAWERIPEPAREEVDQAVADAWDATKDVSVDLASDAWDTAEEITDDLGDSLVGWAVR